MSGWVQAEHAETHMIDEPTHYFDVQVANVKQRTPSLSEAGNRNISRQFMMRITPYSCGFGIKVIGLHENFSVNIALKKTALLLCVICAAVGNSPSYALSERLPATGGVMQIEGAAGGGLVPWALIAGLGTRDQIGGSVFCTGIEPQDFSLTSCGVAVGIRDRVEISYARQDFDLGATVPDHSIQQHIVGVKIKVLGDAVYDQDRWWPQLAVGMQHKTNEDYALVPKLLGARHDSGNDFFVATTKIWLAGVLGRTTLLNATLRATKANQLGLLGFGGDKHDSYEWLPELSAGVFVIDQLIVGAEYRAKPDNLSVFKEHDFKDVFIAWVPNKHVSLTVAHASLGTLADKQDQHGWYASLQGSF
jgi:hypothetical protein